MQVTLRTLVEAAGALTKVAHAPLPARVAFRIGRLVREVDPILAAQEAARVALVKKYGAHDPDTGWRVTQEMWPPFSAEYALLLDELLSVSAPGVTEQDLDQVVLTPLEAMQLAWLTGESVAPDRPALAPVV